MESIEIVAPGVKGNDDSWLGFLQFLASISMGFDTGDHMTANDPVDDSSHLAKKVSVLENPLPKTHLLRKAEDQVTVSNLGESLQKVYRGRFRFAGDAARTDAGLTRERDCHAGVAGLALE